MKLIRYHLHWPKQIADKIEQVATKGKTSIQSIVLRILMDRLGMQYWVIPTDSRTFKMKVEQILEFYPITDEMKKFVEEQRIEREWNRKYGFTKKDSTAIGTATISEEALNFRD